MKLEPMPVQTTLNDISANSFPPSMPLMRVNCATLARLFNVSRTSIKRYVDAGKIQLDAQGLACPKQAAQSVLESSSANRVKAKFFKNEANARTAIEAENATLQKKLDDRKKELIESQTALNKTNATLTEWQDDYIQLENAIESFIEQLTNDNELQQAVQQGNGAFLQNAFDALLDDLEQTNSVNDSNTHSSAFLKMDDELPPDSSFLDADFFNETN